MLLESSTTASYQNVFVYNLDMLKLFLDDIPDHNPIKQDILREVPIYTNYQIKSSSNSWWRRMFARCYRRSEYRVSHVQLLPTNPTPYPLRVHLDLSNITRDCKISLSHRQQEIIEQLYVLNST